MTLQPRLFVVSANQSRACLSVSESARRDMPVSVGALVRKKCQPDKFSGEQRNNKDKGRTR